MRGSYGPGMYDVRVSNKGSPCGVAKGTLRFGSGERFDREKCYEGKENTMTMRGSYGPGMYDVRVSNKGSPCGVAKGTLRFGSGERFDREKCYEGKENTM